MFGTAIRLFAKNPKQPMMPIELTMPPEQAQTFTRVIFDILKEHGPLTVGDTWERVKVVWLKRIDERKAHENSYEMNEGETEAEADMRPCWSS